MGLPRERTALSGSVVLRIGPLEDGAGSLWAVSDVDGGADAEYRSLPLSLLRVWELSLSWEAWAAFAGIGFSMLVTLVKIAHQNGKQLGLLQTFNERLCRVEDVVMRAVKINGGVFDRRHPETTE